MRFSQGVGAAERRHRPGGWRMSAGEGRERTAQEVPKACGRHRGRERSREAAGCVFALVGVGTAGKHALLFVENLSALMSGAVRSALTARRSGQKAGALVHPCPLPRNRPQVYGRPPAAPRDGAVHTSQASTGRARRASRSEAGRRAQQPWRRQEPAGPWPNSPSDCP